MEYAIELVMNFREYAMDIAAILIYFGTPVILILGVAFIILSIFNRFLPKSIGCDFFGWHLEPNGKGFDGASLNGRCPRCGKEVMMDSQGNWF